MFYAAHAALLSVPAAPAAEFKTHRGLIGAFGQHVVTGAKADPALGRSISAVQQLRQIADYLGDPPELDKAESAVMQAEAFVAAIGKAFPAAPNGGSKKP
jgi:uncharacterized protein (UPF0332 family)